MAGGVFGILPEFRHGSAMATAPITILKLMGDHAGLEFLTPTSPSIAIEIADQDRFHVRMPDMTFDLTPILFQVVIFLHSYIPNQKRATAAAK